MPKTAYRLNRAICSPVPPLINSSYSLSSTSMKFRPRQHAPYRSVVLMSCLLAGGAGDGRVAQADDTLSTAARITVRGFRFEGNTVFTAAELSEVVKGYVNREISSDELEEARRKLTQFYIDKGYINSGATLRDQSVSDGVITFSITEGRLSAIQITGNHYFHSGYLKSRIFPDESRPLNVLSLRDNLQLLRQNANVARITADVKPGSVPGEATLAVDVQENKPYGGQITFDNARPPSVGAERFRLSLYDQNVTGRSDELNLSFGLTHDNLKLSNPFDPNEFAVSYLSPTFGPDTQLQASYSKSDTAVIEEPFTSLGITSQSENYALTLQQPLKRTLNEDFGLSLALEHRKSSSFLFGEPFSFSPGDVNGVSQTTALRLGVNYLQRDANQVFASRALLSYSDAFPGTTGNFQPPNGRFLTLLGQAQYIRALDEKGRRLVLRFDGQLADRPLLLVEKFVIGGADSVRGYRENQLVRDSGFAASAELRLPLTYDKANRERLILAPFFDLGYGKNRQKTSSTERNSISSLGVGLIYAGDPRLSAQVYYGYALQKVATSHHDLQDRGIHFVVSYRL